MNKKLMIAGAVVIIAVVGIGLWGVERKLNYKYGYKAQVQQEMKPLQLQINQLEARILFLETNKSK